MKKQSIQVTAPLAPDLDVLLRLNKEIVKSGHYTNFGEKVAELERRLCELQGIKHLRLANNGTMALQVILSMFAKKDKRYVITTPFTFAATASAIVMSGYEPYFVDIDPETLNMDVEKVAGVMSRIGNDVAAILPVHVFGNPCYPIEFEKLSWKYHVPLLFDACHTFASSYLGKPLCSYGDASAMSYHPTKIFHCGEGGGVVLNDASQYSRSKENLNFGYTLSGDISLIAGNAKMSEFNAAIGLSVLGAVPDELANREKLAAIYTSKFERIDEIRFQKKMDGYINNNQYYPIILDTVLRERVVSRLNAENIFPRKYFSPSLSSTVPYSRYSHEPCLVSEKISSEILCIPMYGALSAGDAELIADLVAESVVESVMA
ncbi:DegT/DnrJ/EryC1/StrS family aminotransferase [Pseudomonadota bacterium]